MNDRPSDWHPSPRHTGWLEDPRDADERQLLGEGVFDETLEAMPSASQFYERIPRVRDQRSTSSCVGHACVGAFELLRIVLGLPDVAMSPAHCYWLARSYSDLQREDGGAYTLDGVIAMVKLGVGRESLLPLSTATINDRPGPAVEIDGVTRTVARYDRITEAPFTEARERAVLSALADQCPVLSGKLLPESFFGHSGRGVLPAPEPGAATHGGHLTYYAGYRTEPGGAVSLYEANSWGRGWGIAGGGWAELGWVHHCRDLVVLREAK